MRKQAHQCGDGTSGSICEFTMGDQSWAICHLAIKAGHQFSDKEAQIPTSQVAGTKHTNQQTQNENSTNKSETTSYPIPRHARGSWITPEENIA
jgi:hypothetical protein